MRVKSHDIPLVLRITRILAVMLWISARGSAATVPSQIVDFGTAAVNGPGATATITFSLTGLSAAPVVGIGGVDFSAGAIGCNSNITSCIVTVTFLPKSSGLRQDALILKNGGSLVASAYLHGIGSAPMLQLFPASINTFAGNGNSNYVDGAASTASFRSPQGLAVDLFGNVYVADSVNEVIRKLAAGTGNVSTVAGTGVANYSGDGGLATQATLNSPTGVAVDGAGNLFIADQGNNVIRRIDAVSGIITTVAGGGVGAANNVSPTSVLFSGPNDVAVDTAGNLFISDSYDNLIWKVTQSTNLISVIAGAGSSPGTDGIGDGGPATSARINDPTGITVDPSENVYFADTGHGLIRRIDATTGTIRAVAGDGSSASTGDGGLATSASLFSPTGIRLDASGNLYIADMGGNKIRFVSSSTGIISTIAGNGIAAYSGDGGISTLGSLSNPMDMAIDAAGNLFIADYSNNVIRKVAFRPPALTFPSTNVTLTSAAVPITLNNFGTATLNLSGLSVTGSFQQKTSGGTDCSGSSSVAASASCQINLAFTPTGAGSLSGILTLTSNTGNVSASQTAVNLQGTGLSGYPLASVNTTSLNFSAQAVGTTSAAQTITLTNGGTATLSVASIQIAGANSTDFAISSNGCQLTLASNSSCTISVTASPLLAGSRTAVLTITDSAASSPQTISLAVTGTGGPAPAFSTTTLQFGSQVLTTASASQTVSLQNAGVASLSIFSIAMGDVNATDFSIDNSTCGGTLAPSTACSVTVSFVPTATGTRTASLLFLLSTGSSPVTVTLTGTGVTAPCISGVSPTSQSYTAAGALDTLAIAAAAGCSWSATSNVSWITINSSSTGIGPATLQFSVAANTATQSRTGMITVGSQSESITQAGMAIAPVSSGLRFVPMTPCRVVDTRNPNGPFGGPEIAGATSRDFPIPNGSCGIPSNAQAYAINLTVVPNGGLGYLSVWPTGQAQPATSVLNSDGRVKANATIVSAGTNGSISIYASDPTHVLVDISGYFVPASNASALSFFPLTPCRVADTRSAAGPLGQPYMGGLQSRDFPILSSSCNIPATAQAYSLNFTVVPRGAEVGYLSSWPTGQAQPFVSTLNDFTGTVVANAAIVQAGANGDIDVFVTDDADVIIDINGYFAPQQTGGLSLYSFTPCRVLDTRFSGSGSPLNGTLAISMLNLGQCPVPAAAQTFVLSATVVPEPTLGYLALWPTGNARPLVSTLNAFDGAVTSNMAIVPGGSGSVSAFTSNPSHVILDLFGYFGP